MNFIGLDELSPQDVEAIFDLVDQERESSARLNGTVGWSFEGNGIRTRSSFLQAFRDLGLAITELPNLLKSDERVEDLAGYLDPFFTLYVIRESDHQRLAAFARASERPVINAMSSEGHPCEVLTDAYFIDRSIKPLRSASIVLWGQPTNVFRSWHQLARLMNLSVVQVCPQGGATDGGSVPLLTDLPDRVDIVITDSTPMATPATMVPLTRAHLTRMGHPALLPTPPFRVGGELAFDPVHYPGFVGYRQKALLAPVQKSIIWHALSGRV